MKSFSNVRVILAQGVEYLRHTLTVGEDNPIARCCVHREYPGFDVDAGVRFHEVPNLFGEKSHGIGYTDRRTMDGGRDTRTGPNVDTIPVGHDRCPPMCGGGWRLGRDVIVLVRGNWKMCWLRASR